MGGQGLFWGVRQTCLVKFNCAIPELFYKGFQFVHSFALRKKEKHIKKTYWLPLKRIRNIMIYLFYVNKSYVLLDHLRTYASYGTIYI